MAKDILITDLQGDELHPYTKLGNVLGPNGESAEEVIGELGSKVNGVCRDFTYAGGGGVLLLATVVPIRYDVPWSLRMVVECCSEGSGASFQRADMMLSGVGERLSSYETRNSIADTARRSASGIVFVPASLPGFIRGSAHYLGIDVTGTECAGTRSIDVRLADVRNCLAEPLGSVLPASGTDPAVHATSTIIPFNESGTFHDEIVRRPELAEVAFSGSWNDLLYKPELLEVGVDEEKIIFYKQ